MAGWGHRLASQPMDRLRLLLREPGRFDNDPRIVAQTLEWKPLASLVSPNDHEELRDGERAEWFSILSKTHEVVQS